MKLSHVAKLHQSEVIACAIDRMMAKLDAEDKLIPEEQVWAITNEFELELKENFWPLPHRVMQLIMRPQVYIRDTPENEKIKQWFIQKENVLAKLDKYM